MIYSRFEYWIKIFIALPCNSFNFIVYEFLLNSKTTFLNTIDIDKNLHYWNIQVSNPETEIFRGLVQVFKENTGITLVSHESFLPNFLNH